MKFKEENFNINPLHKSQSVERKSKKSSNLGRRISIRTRDESKEVEYLINMHVHDLNIKIQKLLEEYVKNKLLNNKKNLQKVTRTSYHLIPFNFTMDTLKILDNIFSKATKTKNEIIYIQHYLTSFKSLINGILQIQLKSDVNQLLNQIAKYIKMEKYTHNQILFKFGDKGDKFYFLFYGEVAVIIPKEVKRNMTENEYIIYLCKLLKLKEYGLILKIIESNLHIFNNIQVEHIKTIAIEFSINGRKKYHHQYSISKKNIFNKEIISIDNYIKNVEIETLEKEPNPFLIFEKKKKETKEKEKNKEKDKDDENETEEIEYNEISENENSENEEDNSYLEEIYNLSNEQKNKTKINIRFKDIKLFEYYKVTELQQYTTFGDVALEKELNHKRTATIICIGECNMGVLGMKTYKKCIQTCQDLVRSNNISSVKNLPFFQNVSFEYFNEKYFNYFILVNYHLGEYIFKQKEERNKIYVIKKGEIELSMKGCVIDINNIIDTFDNNDNYQRNKIINKNLFEDDEYSKFYNKDSKIVNWRIFNQYSNDILGLDDCIYQNFYFMDAKCVSQTVKIYEIDYNIFLSIIEDKNIFNEFKKFEQLKKKLITERLQHLREVYVNQNYKEKENSGKKQLIFKNDKEYLSPIKKISFVNNKKIIHLRTFSDEKIKISKSNFSNLLKKESINNVKKLNNKTNINNNDSSSNQNTISLTSLLSPKKQFPKLEFSPLTSLKKNNKILIKNKSSLSKRKYKPYLIESNYSNYVKYVIDGFINNPSFVGHSNLFNLTMNKSKNTKSFFNNLHLKNLTEEKNNYGFQKLNNNNSLMFSNDTKKIQIKNIRIKNNFKKSYIHNS